MTKPVVGNVPQVNKIPVSKPAKKRWLFSFKDFQQYDNFGFNNLTSKWFAGLMSRLADFSKMEIEQLEKNHQLRQDLRYHAIDWNARNIPIKRSDLYWVDPEILNNEAEHIFYQVHISKSMGRIVGYWIENIFHVVLLDPLHNAQPSKYNNYQIRASAIVHTDLTNHLSEIDRIKQMKCSDDACAIKGALMSISVVNNNSNAVICFLEDDFLEELSRQCQTITVTEIIRLGILAASDR